MKKIINKKSYNTDTAKELGGRDNGGFRGDFDFYEETLYQKRTGEFFLHCNGGAASPCRRETGDRITGGELIEPLTHEQAAEWSEKYLTAEEYEKIFEPVPDGVWDFKALRTAAGMTQREIAEKLGISERTQQSWEAGDRLPPEWAQRLITEKLTC